MSKIKDKDIDNVYNAISESPKIQELIRNIASANSKSYTGQMIDRSNEVKDLRNQLSKVEIQLRDSNENLKIYKEFYDRSKFKVDKYNDLAKKIDLQKNDFEKCEVELTKKEKEIEKLKCNISSLENEKNNLSNELESANKTIEILKKKFETPITYFKLYQGLSDSVKSGLENVISDKSEIAFIVSCSSEENLSFIWEYIKDISNNIESKDFIVLNDIFDYFFDVFNESLPEARYKRDDVEIGEDFDEDIYDRCSGSSTSGEITKVVLKGYKSRNTGKIIHKSLVKV